MLLQLSRLSSALKFRGIGTSRTRASTDRQPVFYFAVPFNTTLASVQFTLVDSVGTSYGPYPTIGDGIQSLGPTDPIFLKSSITYATPLPTGTFLITITGTVGGKARTSKARFRILSMPAHGTRLNVAYGTRAGVAYGVSAK